MDERWVAAGVVVLAIALVGAFVVAFHNSASTQTVEVNEKWVKYHGGDQLYLFSDKNGNVYAIDDSILLWTWDASDRYARIQPHTTYQITTYWWRVHILSWYPNAIEVVEVQA